jgi:hypothetical protein
MRPMVSVMATKRHRVLEMCARGRKCNRRQNFFCTSARAKMERVGPSASASALHDALQSAASLSEGVGRHAAAGALAFADTQAVSAGLDLLELLGVSRHEAVKNIHDTLREQLRGK